eukprot:658510-Pyramimonas_sp.AAC.1
MIRLRTTQELDVGLDVLEGVEMSSSPYIDRAQCTRRCRDVELFLNELAVVVLDVLGGVSRLRDAADLVGRAVVDDVVAVVGRVVVAAAASAVVVERSVVAVAASVAHARG